MRLFTSTKLPVIFGALLFVTHNAYANKNMHGEKVSRTVTLSFQTSVADLSADGQAKLRELVAGIASGDIDRVEVAVWSDQAFPKTGDDLPKADRDLADNRIDKVKDFLKDTLDVGSVKAYNMAETSNWLARTFRTDDAELKSVFGKEGSTPVARDDFNHIVKEGGPSKAVAILIKEKRADSTSTNGKGMMNNK